MIRCITFELDNPLFGIEEVKFHFLAIGTRTARVTMFKSGGWSLRLSLGSWLQAQLAIRARRVVAPLGLRGGEAFMAKFTRMLEAAFLSPG